ncbi:hypothetical protein [Microcoleus sp. OTE_8_concoct_300]|uniref:hypothetical protein n=1 Tax=Microcoleus sp. OTE_8_concoct_300 TaxID=2964710 RepID=UPI00403EFB40
MRRIRLFALGIVSFFAVLMGALLAPGTFVNRALSAALCTVFSFSSTLCTVNLAKSSDRVVAATPPAVERNISDWLVQRDPGEFDDAPSVPPASNPQAPPFPQDPGPNQPLRPDFGDSVDDAAGDAANDIGTKFNCDKNQKPPIYAVYVNGVNTPRNVYDQDKVIINQLLKDAFGEKVSLSFDAYNGVGSVRIEGIPLGDFLESAMQSSTSSPETFNANTADGNILVFQVTQKIKDIEKLHDDFRKTANCECHVLKPKYLLIGHSQGNFFVEDIALALPDEVKSRTSILSIASFTSYESIRNKVKEFDYLLRPDDFPLIAMKLVKSIEDRKDSLSQQQLGIGESISRQIVLGSTESVIALAKKVRTPGDANLSALNGIDNNPLLRASSLGISDFLIDKEATFVLMLDAHLIENYIGGPTRGGITIPSFDAMRTDGKRPQPRYKSQVTESYNKAKNKLKMLTEYDAGEYEKKKECSQQVRQSPQPQPTAQQPQQTPQQQLRACRVTGVEKYNNMTMNRGGCAIQGPVMTEDGPVDGKTQCGICNTFIGGLAPRAGSCQEGVETDPRIAFLGLNKPILCPPNWDSGY